MHQQNIDEDSIDRFLEKLDSLFKKYGWKMIVSAPPVIGFLLFFTYFTRNKFYPSFDIIQFSSLLLSAFLIVALTIGALISIMSAPALIFKYLFFESKAAKSSFRKKVYLMVNIEGSSSIRMLASIIASPAILGALLCFGSMILYGDYFVIIFFTIPILVGITSTIESKIRNNLCRDLSLNLFFTTSFSIMIGNLSILTFIEAIIPSIKLLGDDTMQSVALLLIAMAIILTINFSCLVGLAGAKYALYINSIVAVTVLFYSGFATSLPETIVKKLDIGNYKALSIAFKKDFCSPRIMQLDIKEDCTIDEAHIIWSMGDIYFFTKESKQGGTYTFRVPKENIKTIITHTTMDKSNTIK